MRNANGGDRLGERLLKSGTIDNRALQTALALQKREGCLLGEALIKTGGITKEALSNFIREDANSKIGEILLDAGKISPAQLKQALDTQKAMGGRLGDIFISLGYVARGELASILERRVGRASPIGERLLESGKITQEQLQNALAMQKKSGGRLGEILLYYGYVDSETLFRELANQLEVGRPGEEAEHYREEQLPYALALKHSALVVSKQTDHYIIAVRQFLEKAAIREIEETLAMPVEQVLASRAEMDRYWEAAYRLVQRHKSVFELYEEQPQNSAIVTFSKGQLVTLLIIGLGLVFALIANWKDTLFAINLVFQALYAAMTVLKLAIVLKGESKSTQIRFTDAEVCALDEKTLPVYTILVPVYKETEVIKALIKHIDAMDYPKHKLDVRILLEEDDQETISAVNAMHLRSNYCAIVVPKSQPQTKPKACNYGLLDARGEYVVIYDAEDRPEPDQLKKAFLAFRSLPDEYVCLQAKLNYFNSEQNLLTGLFTQEYSMWFETLLVGIMQMDIPVPLGGTSNHFKASFLKEVGGWDPFNVTEDADLGVRLFKFRYKTAILDSRTWEEANSNVRNWIRQRSRWIKGYMQTWLVHMRNPVKLYKSLGLRGFIGYQAMVLGTPLLPLINPVFWLLLILWYATHAGWISQLFPGAFYYLASFQFLFGNFMFTYTNIIGMYAVIRDCQIKRVQPFSYGLIKAGLLTPLYWVLMSVAAYKALFQLVRNPFYWEKTLHGLIQKEDAKDDAKTAPDDSTRIGTSV